MQLVDANVWGYRRFGGDSPHKLLVDTKLTCLIGANEAGKSTLLSLIGEAHDEGRIDRLDRTRDEQVPDERIIVELRYRLDPADLDAIAGQYSEAPSLPHWFVVAKSAGGSVTYEADAKSRRPRAPRKSARAALSDNPTYRDLMATIADEGQEQEVRDAAEELEDRIDALVEAIVDEPATLPSDVLDEIGDVAELHRQRGNEDVAEALGILAASERAEHPTDIARNALWRRCPDFVVFTDADRQLQSEYDLNAVAGDPPTALRNLARLARLDLPDLLDHITANITGTVRTMVDRANARLDVVFSSWTQKPPVRVHFEWSGTQLLIHVASGMDTLMRFDERSDGLRQYVALVAATAQGADHGPPILLIDEVETHLHYDAQVDLIRVLAEQDAVGQVIYTTHSAACLPDDLGSVRVIDPDRERTRSQIRQHFWSDTPGLGPLLMAMGAASLAFVPRRAAVVTEGPSDVILLPTLLREATGSDDLGYQVAPGSSNARPGTIIGLDLQAARTAWLVDGDPGGAAIRAKLLRDGITEAAIVTLGGEHSGIILEHLIEADAFFDAVAAYAKDRAVELDLEPADLDAADRLDIVAAWAERVAVTPPSKVVLANRLLSMRSERALVAPDHRPTLIALHAQLTGALNHQTPPDA